MLAQVIVLDFSLKRAVYCEQVRNFDAINVCQSLPNGTLPLTSPLLNLLSRWVLTSHNQIKPGLHQADNTTDEFVLFGSGTIIIRVLGFENLPVYRPRWKDITNSIEQNVISSR